MFTRHHDTTLDLAIRLADIAATRLVRQLRLPAHDREDLRQDLLVDLVARLRSFDPRRGAPGTFIATVIAHRAGRLARRICRDRFFVPISFQEPALAGEGATLGDGLAEADSYGALMGQPTDPFVPVERRIDLDRALAALGPAHLRLCTDLIERTPTQIDRSGACARASLYRHLGEVRLRLMAQGISAA